MNKIYMERYVDIIVRIGLNINESDSVSILADVETYEFSRMIAKRCLEMGAKDVQVVYYDQLIDYERMKAIDLEKLDYYDDYFFEALSKRASEGESILLVYGKIPGLTADVEGKRLTSFMNAFNKARKSLYSQFRSGKAVWSLVTCPIDEWGNRVYDFEGSKALDKLWEDLFKICRADSDDYYDLWIKHIEMLEKKSEWLNRLDIDILHITARGTDLMVGLPEGAKWRSALNYKVDGRRYFMNIPSEELFTIPHKYKVDGYVSSTKVMSANGNLVEGIKFEVEEGKIVSFSAKVGQKELESLLMVDDNAMRFGEIALVSKSSPITKMDTLFYNLLLDENASSHMAFGDGLTLCFEDSASILEKDKDGLGINSSTIHEDFMIGDENFSVDAILKDGRKVSIMKNQEWCDIE